MLKNSIIIKNVFRNNGRRFSTIAKTKWESVVGLEVHAQISSTTKLFSGSPTKFGSPVNTNVSLFDCSIPGTLPVLNKRCVEAGVLTALALNCTINPTSSFVRKHYFYADIPAGYQITQQRSPLANDGNLEFHVFTPGIHKTPYKTRVRIKQLQLEQDSGKSLHDTDRSLVDLNRAGMPLMELVFEPDLKDGEEAAALIKELISILQRINTCSCKMEEGALRVDANVSINKKGEPMGVRTEIKNINSVRAVAAAVKHEIQRQIKLVESGGTITNETRAWDSISKATVGMRDKEEQQDYRYMPEPNLPPLHLSMGGTTHGCVNVDELKDQIGELPEQTRCRLKDSMGLTSEQAIILVNDYYLLKIFESALKVQKFKVNEKLLANLLINDFNTLLNKQDLEPVDVCNSKNYQPTNFAEIVQLLETGDINRVTSRLLLEEILKGNEKRPGKIVVEKNLQQITDENLLTQLCEKVLSENPEGVKEYKAGKVKVFKAFLGGVAKSSNNKANMEKVSVILKKLLEK